MMMVIMMLSMIMIVSDGDVMTDVSYYICWCNFSCIDEWFAVNRTCPEHPGDWCVTDVPCVKTTDSFIVIWGSCSGWLPLNWVLVPAVVLIPSNVRPCSVMVSFTCIVCVLFTDVRVGFVLSLACGVLVLMTLCVFCLGKGSFTVTNIMRSR